MSKLRTHYDNLQVAENASIEVIRGAYKYLCQKWHPDKHPQDRERATRVMKILNDAYAVLSDPESRRQHDEWIARQRPQAPTRKANVQSGTATSRPPYSATAPVFINRTQEKESLDPLALLFLSFLLFAISYGLKQFETLAPMLFLFGSFALAIALLKLLGRIIWGDQFDKLK